MYLLSSGFQAFQWLDEKRAAANENSGDTARCDDWEQAPSYTSSWEIVAHWIRIMYYHAVAELTLPLPLRIVDTRICIA